MYEEFYTIMVIDLKLELSFITFKDPLERI